VLDSAAPAIKEFIASMPGEHSRIRDSYNITKSHVDMACVQQRALDGTLEAGATSRHSSAAQMLSHKQLLTQRYDCAALHAIAHAAANLVFAAPPSNVQWWCVAIACALLLQRRARRCVPSGPTTRPCCRCRTRALPFRRRYTQGCTHLHVHVTVCSTHTQVCTHTLVHQGPRSS
jgi:hypothetical protein